ncbi:hypothetical protein QFZ66_000447 [Streptomyces sp. B4I13]|nr:hypothetical protein [Streptomyces sp. B4I13]
MGGYRGPGAVRGDDQRQGMAGARQREAPGNRVVDGVQAGGAGLAGRLEVTVRPQVAGEVQDQVVQMGQQFVRRQVDVGEGADRRAQSAHAGRGVQTVADDIADDQGDPGAGQRNDVEPVAAHFRAGPAGQVAGGHLDRLLVGQPLRQQAALQGQRGRALARVPAGVVDGDGCPGGQLFGEDEVVGGEGLGPVEAGEGDDAEQRAARPERHGDPAGQSVRGDGLVDHRVARRPVGRVRGEPGSEGPLAALAGLDGELDRGPAGGHAAGGDGTGSMRDPCRRRGRPVGVLLRAVPGGTAELDRLAGGERGRGGRLLSAQHLLEEIHADEVDESRHRGPGQFLVPITSSVRPMPPLAWLRRSRRCRAQYSALMSNPQLATARTLPSASRTGHMLVAQALA